MPKPRLISYDLCPFVQRSIVTLIEKGVDFDIDYIDLSNKPDWFLELSPTGKVPTLVETGEDGELVVLFESVVINEYLDETTPGRMLPEAALPRARARAWIEFANAVLSDTFEVTSVKDEESLEKVMEKLRPKLDKLERELPDPGPFFLGSEMSLVDAAFAPALQRLHWSDGLYPLGLYDGRPKLALWWTALAERPSVRDSAGPDLHERFEKMVARDRGGYRSIVGARVAS